MNGPAASPRLQAKVYSAADTCRPRSMPVATSLMNTWYGGKKSPTPMPRTAMIENMAATPGTTMKASDERTMMAHAARSMGM